MSRIRTVKWFFIIAFAGLLEACSGPSETAPVADAPTPAEVSHRAVEVSAAGQELGGIRVAEARLEKLGGNFEVAGRIDLDENRTIRVGAILAGRVDRVLVAVGQRVEEGEVLAELASPEAAEVRAELAMARVEQGARRSRLDHAVRSRERMRRLLELKAGSLQDLQQAEAEARQAEADLLLADREIIRLEERLARWGVAAFDARPADTTDPREGSGFGPIPITAPRSGTVLERMVTPGTVVSVSEDLFVISDLSRVWVHAQVPERMLSRLQAGQGVELTVAAHHGRSFPARIRLIGDLLEPSTRTVEVLCEAANPDRLLKPLMYATVRFYETDGEERVVIPRSSLQNLEGRDVVFVESGPGRFEVREIQPGRVDGDRVEVVQGLRVGERVGVEGAFLLKSEYLKGRLTEE